MARIHPTAIVESGAQLDESVSVGEYSIVREQAECGCRISSPECGMKRIHN